MGELNIISLFYVAFRLAPFILVCFFTLSSIFNQDLKGFVYLIGLLLACFIAVIIGNSSNSFIKETSQDPLYGNVTKVCNVLNLGKDGPISNLPLSTVVFSYTLIYLVYPISQNGTAIQNIPTLILFPILIIGEIFWNIKNGCSYPFPVFAALTVGSLVGFMWSSIIYNLKIKNLLYLNGISNKEVCSKPTKQKFRCTPNTANI